MFAARAALTVIVVAAGMQLATPRASAAPTVTINCNTQSLYGALTGSTPGMTLKVSGTCEGNYEVPYGMTIEGNPTATLDGEFLGTVLTLTGTAPVHLQSLVITGGKTDGGGGGIRSESGAALTLNKVTVENNSAQGSGGGIESSSAVTLSNSLITNNEVSEASTGTDASASGGGIYLNAPLTITNSTVSNNEAAASSDVGSGNAGGGGVFEKYGAVTISGSTFSGNSTFAGGETQGTAQGGAVVALPAGTPALTVSNTKFTTNTATATSTTDAEADGGGLYVEDAAGSKPNSISGSTFAANAGITALHGSGTAYARGGAIDADDMAAALRISTTAISGNKLSGSAFGGGVFLSGGGLVMTGPHPLQMSRSTVSGNSETVTHADGSSDAEGAGLDLGSAATDIVTNSTISRNTTSVTSTAPQVAAGAGVAAYDTALAVRYSTVVGNTAKIGTGAGTARGGGILVAGSEVSLLASILTNNTARTGANCAGTPTSSGHNLLSKTGCAITATSTDVRTSTPKLGSLKSNGGPTKTIALLKGSPALDRIATATCHATVTTDQRGVKRPQGSKCDIGAFERKPPPKKKTHHHKKHHH